MNKKFKCISIIQDESGFSVNLQLESSTDPTITVFGSISFSRLSKTEANQFVVGNFYEIKPITA